MNTDAHRDILKLLAIIAFIGASSALKTKQLKSGDTLRLRCSAKINGNTDDVQWSVPGNLAEDRFEILSFRLKEDDRTWSVRRNIKVTKVTAEDTGYYTCFHVKGGQSSNSTSLQENIGSKNSWIKRVYVYVYDPSALILDLPQSLDVELGADLVLPCRSSHENTTVNISHFAATPPLDMSRVVYNPTMGFIVEDATHHDDGMWKCIAVLEGVKRSRRIVVNVVEVKDNPIPGEIDVFSNPPSILQHKPVEITCRVPVLRGVKIEIYWRNLPFSLADYKIEYGYYDPLNTLSTQSPLESRKNIIIWWSKLILYDPLVNDTGIYTCEVAHKNKTKSGSTKVLVYDFPFYEILSEPVTNASTCGEGLCVARGTTADLSFKINAIPQPHYEWYNGSQKITYSDGSNDTRRRINGGEFLIHETNPYDSGNYTLKIITENTTISKTVHLLIKEPQAPRIMGGPKKERSANLGQDITLLCDAIGLPVPQIHWHHGDTQLYETSSVLKLQRVTWGDEGTYTCYAHNKFGTDSYEVMLSVKSEEIGRTNYFLWTEEWISIPCQVKPRFQISTLGFLAWRSALQGKCEVCEQVVCSSLWLIKPQMGEIERSQHLIPATSLHNVINPTRGVQITSISIISIMAPLLFCISWLSIRRRRKVHQLKRKLKLQQLHLVPIIDPLEMPLEEKAQCLAYDPKKWEFPRDRLRFGKTLGRGAFGKVVQATAFDLEKTSSCRTIAVKMLKVGSRSSEYSALMSELRILIHLGPHLNIVNLLGACTTKDGPLMILVEYCRHGNLSVYLRGMRDAYAGSDLETGSDSEGKKKRLHSDDSVDDGAFLDDADQRSWIAEKPGIRTSYGSEADTIGSNECDGTGATQFSGEYEDSAMSTRKISEANDDEEDKKEKKEGKKSLSFPDLLSYSLQVSRGMEFLASKKCIHRDLAARNVLLSDYQVVKICDFGLARDVYKNPDYVRAGEARLPLKWMAPESIFDKIYSTQSDVWAFGILLWEIFTLGGSPYPGLQIDEDFCLKLQRGVRMSKPKYATDSVYSAMLACWANSPDERPSFTKLCEELSDVLQTEAGNEYLDLMKLFDADVEGKLPLRGVKPQQIPDETFEEASPLNKPTDAAVTYVDVEVGVLHDLDSKAATKTSADVEELSIIDNQDSFDSVIETTQDSIAIEQLTINAGYLSEDSGMGLEKQSSYAKECSAAPPCEPPPLYDDVIALRNRGAL